MTIQWGRCCVFSHQENIDNRSLAGECDRRGLWIVALRQEAGTDTNTVKRNGETTSLSQCVHIFAEHS